MRRDAARRQDLRGGEIFSGSDPSPRPHTDPGIAPLTGSVPPATFSDRPVSLDHFCFWQMANVKVFLILKIN